MRAHAPALTRKLAQLWSGPFRVIAQPGPVNFDVHHVYTKKMQRVHVNRLKIFRTFNPEAFNDDLTLKDSAPTTDGPPIPIDEPSSVTDDSMANNPPSTTANCSSLDDNDDDPTPNPETLYQHQPSLSVDYRIFGLPPPLTPGLGNPDPVLPLIAPQQPPAVPAEGIAPLLHGNNANIMVHPVLPPMRPPLAPVVPGLLPPACYPALVAPNVPPIIRHPGPVLQNLLNPLNISRPVAPRGPLMEAIIPPPAHAPRARYPYNLCTTPPPKSKFAALFRHRTRQ